MKNILIFIGGVITGVILLSVIESINNNKAKNKAAEELINNLLLPQNNDNDIVIFQEPGDCLKSKSKTFEVFQVLDSKSALANEVQAIGKHYMETGLVVLFFDNKENSYYDNQIIEIPEGKCIRQIGIYKYTQRFELEKKTIPIVSIFNE